MRPRLTTLAVLRTTRTHGRKTRGMNRFRPRSGCAVKSAWRTRPRLNTERRCKRNRRRIYTRTRLCWCCRQRHFRLESAGSRATLSPEGLNTGELWSDWTRRRRSSIRDRFVTDTIRTRRACAGVQSHAPGLIPPGSAGEVRAGSLSCCCASSSTWDQAAPQARYEETTARRRRGCDFQSRAESTASQAVVSSKRRGRARSDGAAVRERDGPVRRATVRRELLAPASRPSDPRIIVLTVAPRTLAPSGDPRTFAPSH
jgi:hypothetical protein